MARPNSLFVIARLEFLVNLFEIGLALVIDTSAQRDLSNPAKNRNLVGFLLVSRT